MADFELVQYMDPITKKPTGAYAKRFPDGFDTEPVDTTVLNPNTGELENIIVIRKLPKFRDELIPVRYIARVDETGKMIGLAEVRLSEALELGGTYYGDLKPGHSEKIIDKLPSSVPGIPASTPAREQLSRILDTFKIGPETPDGKSTLIPV